MQYLLVGDDNPTLFVEDGNNAYRYNATEDKWIFDPSTLHNARIGFDPYEPEDSIYRYGATEYLKKIVAISKEEAEKFVGKKIDETVFVK